MTLLGQSFGSVMVVMEALLASPCSIYIDTMGYAFTLPFARTINGSYAGCYVHYPTISTDMLDRVRDRRPSYNNSERISSSGTVSTAKLIYYRVFSWMYGFAGGRFSRVTMVNSSWTKNHIESLWGVKTLLVYPPCLTLNATTQSSDDDLDEDFIKVKAKSLKKTGGRKSSTKVVF
jgi:alpha-1,2-mannosyltransferase